MALQPSKLSASDLIVSWRSISEDRETRALPEGLSERIRALENDSLINTWFINKLILAVASLESDTGAEWDRKSKLCQNQ